MAPGATIVVQSALSPENVDLQMAQNAAVSKDGVQIISNSYGGSADSTDNTSDGYWEQAIAAGNRRVLLLRRQRRPDSRRDLTGDRSVDAGPNSPYVTAVGGTTLAIGRTANYQFETYWGTDPQP